MTLSFGTDGVRGIAHSELTTKYVQLFGRAASEEFEGCSWLVGRDTRESSLQLSKSLANGLASTRGEVFDLGVVPTPLVAAASKIEEMPAVMVSASHNIWSDNGLKIFGPGGIKLSDNCQSSIEERLKNLLETESEEISEQQATPYLEPDADYLRSLVLSLEGRDLRGQRIVIDCANGAGYKSGPKLLKSLKANVIAVGVNPNGLNINKKCGSTFPKKIQSLVKKHKAHIGISLDGDADRVIMCDENCNIIDGDQNKSLTLKIGTTYEFDHSTSHPLRFSTTSDGTHGGGAEYTTGVTTSSGSTVIEVNANTATSLYYYCSIHSGMGGTITVTE